MPTSLHNLTIHEARDLLDRRQVSSVELTQAYLDRIQSVDPKVRAYITVTAEQALEIAEALIRSNAVDIVVLDSVAALVPRAEVEGDMGDPQMGLQARLMSQALRKLTAAISKTKCCMIFINQLRDKVGIMFGNPETTPGGRALKFYSSVRIDLRRTETIKNGNDSIGNRVKARVVKNKVAPPFRTAEFDIMFNEGISKSGDLVDLGVEFGMIKKSGAFFSFGDNKLGQGRENVKQFLRQHENISDQIEKQIRSKAAEATVASLKSFGEVSTDKDKDNDEE